MTEPDQRIDRRLDRLAEVSARGQWQLDQAIDWTCSPAASPWVPRRSYVGLVSQLFHGEAAALALTGRLLAAFSHDAHARAALVWQEVDERRHVAVHVACLARLGEIAESTSVLKEALEAMLPWQGPPAALCWPTTSSWRRQPFPSIRGSPRHWGARCFRPWPGVWRGTKRDMSDSATSSYRRSSRR